MERQATMLLHAIRLFQRATPTHPPSRVNSSHRVTEMSPPPMTRIQPIPPSHEIGIIASQHRIRPHTSRSRPEPDVLVGDGHHGLERHRPQDVRVAEGPEQVVATAELWRAWSRIAGAALPARARGRMPRARTRSRTSARPARSSIATKSEGGAGFAAAMFRHAQRRSRAGVV